MLETPCSDQESLFLKFQRTWSPTSEPWQVSSMLSACPEAVKQFLSAINSKAHLLKVSVFRDVFIASKHSSHLPWRTLGCKLFHWSCSASPLFTEKWPGVEGCRRDYISIGMVRKCCSGFTHGLPTVLLINYFFLLYLALPVIALIHKPKCYVSDVFLLCWNCCLWQTLVGPSWLRWESLLGLKVPQWQLGNLGISEYLGPCERLLICSSRHRMTSGCSVISGTYEKWVLLPQYCAEAKPKPHAANIPSYLVSYSFFFHSWPMVLKAWVEKH